MLHSVPVDVGNTSWHCRNKLHNALHEKPLLAWAIQVNDVSEDMRLVQGHQRGRTSFKIYSTGDVFRQVKLQKILLDAIKRGFRPRMAQHRGSQSPLVEPPVDLESFCKTWQQPKWKMFNFSTENQTQKVVDSVKDLELDISDDDSDSSEASSIDSSSSADPAVEPTESSTPTIQLTPNVPDVAVLNHGKMVQRAMVLTSDTSQPMFDRRHFEAACGVHLNPAPLRRRFFRNYTGVNGQHAVSYGADWRK